MIEPTVAGPPRFFGRRAWYRRRVESLEQQAVIDALTGLRNQRALWRELSRRTGSCSKAAPLTLVMLDFDRFRDVNEAYGHAVGDAVLASGAVVLRGAAASPRLAFRYGGEEFVLLVAGDEDQGRDLAERVRSEIAEPKPGALPAVTVSCGVAELDSPVEPWVALDRVDAALRDAKRTGRNRVALAGRTDGTTSAYLVEELEHETARRAAMALAVATLEVRHRHTADHSGDVLTLCESIGRQLGFDARAIDRLVMGAQLHDIGKVGVPPEILNKPGPLNDAEWAVIHEHTVIGERILRSVPEMADVATVVRHSHERWDGSGYPDGLVGEQIPLASRVILCADAFHAMRSDRPYRAGRPAHDALDELRACAGTQLDPDVVGALLRVADDVRGGGAGKSTPRNRRLLVLLTALAIATGAAVAAVPGLRDAIGSVFGATTSEHGGALSVEPRRGFSFGPLGDRLRLVPSPVEPARARARARARRHERKRPSRHAPRAGPSRATPSSSRGRHRRATTPAARQSKAAPTTPARSPVSPAPQATTHTNSRCEHRGRGTPPGCG